MSRPFQGIKILDFTQAIAGPYVTYQFALLGADVIKVERREGEELRVDGLYPSPLSKEWTERGLAPSWQAVNGGKRSLTLDLQKPGAVEIIKDLVSDVDVVIENFRPGVMDKLGLGYDALSAINPKLIYCAISAFGQTGPERLARGYDGKIQAMSGIMALTGHEGGGPMRAGFAVCDFITGSIASFAVSSALFHRMQSGKGQLVDVSMLESALSFMSAEIAEYTVAGNKLKPLGNSGVSLKATSNLFKCGDGHILLAVTSEKSFQGLMQALGQADVLTDPRFSDWDSRRLNEPALRKIIEDVLATKTAIEWDGILNAAGAISASVRKLEEVIDHPQVVARKSMQQLDTPYGELRFAGLGFQLAHGNGKLDRMAPQLGEHSDEVLAERGYTPDEVARLRDAGVI